MSNYPIFLDLQTRRVVIIGGGAVALRKAETLVPTGARLVIVAASVTDTIQTLSKKTDVELINSKYSKEYLVGAVLVIAATNNRQLNKRIYKDCQELEILCNVVDDPEICNFYVPASVKRGDLQIAISTEGRCPAYAGHLRKKLEKIFTDYHGKFLSELEKLREQIIEEVSDPSNRKALLGQLVDDKSFEYFVENGPEQWRKYAQDIISAGK